MNLLDPDASSGLDQVGCASMTFASTTASRAPMIELCSGDVDVWLTFHDQIIDPRLQHRYQLLLSPREREQQERFHFRRDQLRYLVTRALVRTVLSRYLPVDETGWIFATNAYGRPYVSNACAQEYDLRFNVSHTCGLIALAITRGSDVGVDVENIRTQEVDLDIAERFFAPAEVVALSRVPMEERQLRFFEYWTFKESYIKARGMGLSLPLDKFAFEYPGDRRVRISVDAELGDHADRWQFWQLSPGADHLVAICAERVAARAARLSVRRIVPGIAEQALSAPLTRISGPCAAGAFE